MRNLKEIKDNIRKLYALQLEKKDFEEYYNKVREKEQLEVTNWIFANEPDLQSFDVELDEGREFYGNPVKVHVAKVRKKKITWFVDKLKKALEKDKLKQIIRKTYTINDMQGLVKYLKSCGVDPKKFKTFIDVEETVNEAEFDKLYDTGEIKLEDVKGCYKMEMGKPYLRITEQK